MDDEKSRLIANLGDKSMLILRNHGLLTCGRSIAEAFHNMWVLQRSCEIQLASDSSGKAINPVGDEIIAQSEKLMAMQSLGGPAGQLEFDALVRIIDKIDLSYKD